MSGRAEQKRRAFHVSEAVRRVERQRGEAVALLRRYDAAAIRDNNGYCPNCGRHNKYQPEHSPACAIGKVLGVDAHLAGDSDA